MVGFARGQERPMVVRRCEVREAPVLGWGTGGSRAGRWPLDDVSGDCRLQGKNRPEHTAVWLGEPPLGWRAVSWTDTIIVHIPGLMVCSRNSRTRRGLSSGCRVAAEVSE